MPRPSEYPPRALCRQPSIIVEPSVAYRPRTVWVVSENARWSSGIRPVLTSANAERVVAGNRTREVPRVRITHAGQGAHKNAPARLTQMGVGREREQSK